VVGFFCFDVSSGNKLRMNELKINRSYMRIYINSMKSIYEENVSSLSKNKNNKSILI